MSLFLHNSKQADAMLLNSVLVAHEVAALQAAVASELRNDTPEPDEEEFEEIVKKAAENKLS